MRAVEVLSEFFATASEASSTEDLLERSLAVLSSSAGLPTAALFLLQPDGSLALHACLAAPGGDELPTAFRPHPAGSIARVLRSRQAVLREMDDPPCAEPPGADPPPFPPPKVLVPLHSTTRTLGVAVLWGTRRRPFAQDAAQALTLLGCAIGEAFEKATLLELGQPRSRGAEVLSHALLDTVAFSSGFRLRAHEFLERITSSAVVGGMVLDRKGTILYFNRGAEGMTGYRAEELVGKKRVKDLYANRADLGQITRALVHSGGIEGHDVTLVRKDGTPSAVHISASAVHGPSGRVVGSILLLVDVTEKKRLEKELFRSEKLKALGEMAGGVAHDFNNILSTILGNVEMILKHNDDPALAERLKVIQDATLTGAETVRRIQDFTRVRRERDFEPVDLNRVVMDSVELTRHRWRDAPQRRGVPLSLTYHLHKLWPVQGNPYEIREVLMNLIFNAVDAMPEGGRLMIRTAAEGGHALVAVADTGIGMTEEVRARIFEPFFTTKGEGNTGLGLSVSYGIVTRHDGSIEVESQPGSGTAFRLRFPMIEGRGPWARGGEAEQGAERSRILVIDDEKGVRDVLGEFLESVGHEVLLASSGPEGLEIFRSTPCQVVITDLGMPRMSGWEVAREIRAIAPRAAFILTTGWGDLVDPERAREEGIDLVLAKPFQLDHLLDSIEEAVRRRRQSSAPISTPPVPSAPPLTSSIH